MPAADGEVGEGVDVQAVVPFHRRRENVADPLHVPVLVEVGGDGGGGGGLDVGGRREVGEPLGEVDGADALREVGELLDGRRDGPLRRL